MPVDRVVLTFYLMLALITTAVVSGIMLTKRVPSWARGLLIMLYLSFVIGGWLVEFG